MALDINTAQTFQADEKDANGNVIGNFSANINQNPGSANIYVTNIKLDNLDVTSLSTDIEEFIQTVLASVPTTTTTTTKA